jgi:hypothetical protein
VPYYGKGKVDPELGNAKNVICVAQLKQSASNCGHHIKLHGSGLKID